MKRIAHVTDLHLDEPFPADHGVDGRSNWTRIIQDIASRSVDAIVLGGDLGESGSLPWLFDSLEGRDLSVVLGNHDRYADVSVHFKDPSPTAGNELCYSREDGDFKVVFLDSSADAIGERQLVWLRAELRTDRPVLVFVHHPVLPVDTPVDRKYPLAGRERIRQVLQESGSALTLFCGHYHMPDEQVDGNVTQYLTPACSYQVEKTVDCIRVNSSDFGYRIIDLDGDKVSTSLVLL